MKRDKVEYSLKYLLVKKKVEKRVKQILMDEYGTTNGLGMCHTYWRIKKQILRDDYGIDWCTPAEMNPGILFD